MPRSDHPEVSHQTADCEKLAIDRAAALFRPREIIMKRLLVVDDALFMRKLICGVAAEAGWQVVGEAGNGAEAISLYQQHRPDLVTMDLVMPVMGGLEALRQIRAIDPEAKVVVVTALDQKQSLMDSIRDGAIDFIVKPFERERVVALLAKLENAAAPKTSA
jgi:two-component system, chemotaxis family, chemotaxis protein CheY